MKIPEPRGPLTRTLFSALACVPGSDEGGAAVEELRLLVTPHVAVSSDIIGDDDVQLALFCLYELHYSGLEGISDEWEWEPGLIQVRRLMERPFEAALRAAAASAARDVTLPPAPELTSDAVADLLFGLAASDTGPSVSRFVAKKATLDQLKEFLVHKSIYQLKEADPHTWAIPRLSGRPKAALVEIQADEYGGGRPERVHAAIFAASLRGAGLDDAYGTYVDDVPAITLASHNMMSMFGLNRRLLGAIVGHLAAFEMTSSIPNRLYADGLRRLGFGDDVTDYFDEHVEADAVHEQIAARDLAGALAEDRPDLLADIMFGAAACLTVDGWVGQHMLDAWSRGESSLRAGASS